jgi:hypothetical protein
VASGAGFLYAAEHNVQGRGVGTLAGVSLAAVGAAIWAIVDSKGSGLVQSGLKRLDREEAERRAAIYNSSAERYCRGPRSSCR